MSHPIGKRTAVRSGRSLERTRNADELGLQLGGADPDGRITVATHVGERKIGGLCRIAERKRRRDIARFLELERGADPMAKSHVDSWKHSAIRRVVQVERTQRMGLGEIELGHLGQSLC